MDNVTEVWKSVKGFEGQYEVSNHGRVRSLDREVTCLSRWGSLRVMKMRGRILRYWKPESGYLCVGLNSGNIGVNFQIHRLVAEAFIGDAGEKHVNHIDGNKTNNLASNLEYVTPKENTAHAMHNGLMQRVGESNPAAKNTADQIRRAHALVIGGATYREASAATGVKASVIVSACLGKTWKSLGLKVINRGVGWNQFSQAN